MINVDLRPGGYSRTVALWPPPQPETIHDLYRVLPFDDGGNNPAPVCPPPPFRGVEAYPRAGSVSWWKDVAQHVDPAFAEFQWLKTRASQRNQTTLLIWYIDQYDYWADISCLEGGG